MSQSVNFLDNIFELDTANKEKRVIREENVATKSNFRRGLSSGIDSTQGLLHGAVGIAGDALGIDAIRDWGFEGYERNMDEASLNPLDVQNFTDIESISDTGKWFAGTIGQLAPSMAQGLVSALVGGGLGGIAARQLAVKAIDKAVVAQVKRGIAKEVAETNVKKGIADVAFKNGWKIGGNTGIIAGTGAMEGGGMWGEDATEHGVENANALSATGLGLVSGASELVSPGGMLIRRIAGIKGLNPVSDKVSDLFIKRLGTEIPKAMGGEAAQEIFQSFLGILNKKIQDPSVSLTDREAIHEYINSGAAGAAGGVLFGGAGAIKGNKAQVDPTEPDLPAEHTVDDVLDEHDTNTAVESAVAKEEINAANLDMTGSTVGEILGESTGFNKDIARSRAMGAIPSSPGSENTRLQPHIKEMALSLYPDESSEGSFENPEWVKIKTLKKWEKETGEPVKSYVSSTSSKETLRAVLAGEQLTEKQAKVWGYLKSVAENKAMVAEQNQEVLTTVPKDDGQYEHLVPLVVPQRQQEATLVEPIEEEGTGELPDDWASASPVEPEKSAQPVAPQTITDPETGYEYDIHTGEIVRENTVSLEPLPESSTEKHEVIDNPDSAAHGQEMNTNPSEKQKEAENYSMAHVKRDGLDISIENPAGSIRKGKSQDGKEWESTMENDYGRFKGTVGYDRDHVDLFLAKGYKGGGEKAYIVNQYNQDGTFDEHKVVLGATSDADAMAIYKANYEAGWTGGKSVASMPMAEFKEWVKSDAPSKGELKVKPEGSEGSNGSNPSAVNSPSGFDIVEHQTKKRLLRGIVRTDLTKAEAMEIDKYTFKKDGGFFIREKHLKGLELTSDKSDGKTTETGQKAESKEKAHTRGKKNITLPTGDNQEASPVKSELSDHQGDNEKNGSVITTSSPLKDEVKKVKGKDNADNNSGTQFGTGNNGDSEVAGDTDKADASNGGTDTAGGSSAETTEDSSGDESSTIHSEPVRGTNIDKENQVPKSVQKEEPLTDKFAGNKMFTSDAVAAAKERMKARTNSLNSGFDPIAMQDVFIIGGAYFESGIRGFADWSKAVTGDIGKEFEKYLPDVYSMICKTDGLDQTGMSSQEEVDAFLHGEEKEVKAPESKVMEGTNVEASTADLDTMTNTVADSFPSPVEQTTKLSNDWPERTITFSDFFFKEYEENDWNYKSITQPRKAVAEHFGIMEESKTGPFKKAVDEAIEYAVVKISRRMFKNGLTYGGLSGKKTFDNLVRLYGQQPKLGTRTSESIRNQAYSTPAPIAFLANFTTGMTQRRGEVIYEPTAGTGMLLMGADLDSTIAGDLDPTRIAILKDQGLASVLSGSALDHKPVGEVDVVVTNPPFGKLKDETGEAQIFKVNGFKTKEIDQAITLHALDSMAENGRAALIIGGLDKQVHHDERAKKYGQGARKKYFKELYDKYNVTDHFTVSGDLYNKQGAGWPIDVIVIDGKGQSEKAQPNFVAPPIYRTFEALGERIEEIETTEKRNFGVDATRSQQEQATPVRGARTVATGSPYAANSTTNGSTSTQTIQPGQEGNGSGTGSTTGSNEQVGSNRTPDVRSTTAGAQSLGEDNTDSGREPGTEDVSESGNEGVDGTGGSTGSQETIGDNDAVPVVGSTGGRSSRKVVASKGQAHYKPESKGGEIGTLTPINMSKPLQDALKRLASKHGSVDKFVQKSLKYKTQKELHKAFSAEQVDAVALALDNIQNGNGFILGDQTGIGKGRVVAAMIRYAYNEDKVPVFMTEKQALYSDMYRDMMDIGFEPGIVDKIMQTNSDTVILDEDNDVQLASPSKWSSTLGDITGMPTVGMGKKAQDKRIIFTTYDQLNIQYVKGTDRPAPRRRFMQQLMNNENVVLIMDEAHNAGGSGDLENLRPSPKTGIVPHPRALLMRQLIPLADGVVYSSATYAKNPDVMDLYSATDLRLGVGGDIGALASAVTKGGIPFQQITAGMLTNAGQYIRRERSFEGVTYEPLVMPVDHKVAEDVSAAMAQIREFEEAFIEAALEGDEDAKGSNSVGATGEQAQTFTSLMHNIIDQMLLSLKVKPSVEYAIKVLEKGKADGEQVVLTVSNTMGAFLDRYADANNLEEGDEVKAEFNDLLQRYLHNTRLYTTGDRDEKGDLIKYALTDAQLGEQGVAAYRAVQQMISKMDLSGLPVSPVDYMLNELNMAGFPGLEITGRSTTIDYSGNVPVLSKRDPFDRTVNGRNKTIRNYNEGKNRAIILNRSGSTGISLHASERNPENGQGKRTMIVVQAEKDINVHMQMLGRVHRTGQVIEPGYIQAVADIPAEMKPAALLLARMSSLNANTTADADSLFTDKETVNFLNKYGDRVGVEAMLANPMLNSLLGSPVTKDAKGKVNAEGAIKKITGRLPLLPIAQQEQVYNELIEAYKDLIAELDSTGRNDLEAKTFDLDARTIEVMEVSPKSGDSPFQGAANAERVNMKRIGKPYTSEELQQLVEDNKDQGEDEATDALKEFESYRNEAIAEAQKKVDEAENDSSRESAEQILEQLREKLNQDHRSFTELNEAFTVGSSMVIELKMDENDTGVKGVVIGKIRRGNPKNSLALSTWRVKVAVADGMRVLNLPFSKFNTVADHEARKVDVRLLGVSVAETGKSFDSALSSSREERWIVTGNLFTGFTTFQKANGQIINFTRDNGETEQGVLMPRTFDPETALQEAPVAFETVEQVEQVEQYLNVGDLTLAKLRAPGDMRIANSYGTYTVSTQKAVSKAGRYFRDDRALLAITGSFTSTGSRMRTEALSLDQIREVIELFKNRGNIWFADSKITEAREIVQSNPRLSVTKAPLKNPADIKVEIGAAGGDFVSIISPDEISNVNGSNYSKNGRIQGVTTADGKVYLVQGNIPKGKVWSVLLHELGVHSGRLLASNSEFKQIQKSLEKRKNDNTDTGRAIRTAFAKVPKGTKQEHVLEEVLAYLVENNQEIGLVRRVIAIIKRALVKVGFSPDILTANDLTALAEVAVRYKTLEKGTEDHGSTDRGSKSKETGRDEKGNSALSREVGRMGSRARTGENDDIRYSIANETPDSPLSIDSLQEIAENKGTISYIKKSKVDSTFLDRIFSTPEYYFKKFAAAGRVLQAALLRRDIRHEKEQEILDDYVSYIQELRKNFKKAYKQANEYLLGTDQEADGYRIKIFEVGEADNWRVIAPEWAIDMDEIDEKLKDSKLKGDKKNHQRKQLIDDARNIGEFDDESKAIAKMIEAEGATMRENGHSAEAIKAVKMARELTNRGFDVMAADMRAIISEAKENGLPDPFIGDGKLDDSGRYGVYAKGKSKPIALYASQQEAEQALSQVAELVSYSVSNKRGKKRNFKSKLRAKQWAAKRSGSTVKGEKTFQNLIVKKRSDSDMRPLTVKMALAQMGDLRGIYFPRIREAGEYTLIAKKDGVNPIRKHYDIPTVGDNSPNLQKLLNSVTPIGREAKKLKLRGYEVTIAKDESPAEDVFEATNLVTSLDTILQDSMTNINKNDAAEVRAGQHINQILTMQIADIFKSRGYLSSRIKRLSGDVVWEGYEEDMGKAMTQYGKSVAAGTAKRDTARAMVLAFSGRDYSWAEYKQEVEEPKWDEYQEIIEKRRIDDRKQKNLFRDVRSFMVDILRNDEQADRILGTLKGLAVLKYLGFRVSSAAVNMTNMVQGVPATISGHTGESLKDSVGRVISAAKVYAKYRKSISKYGDKIPISGDISKKDRAIFEEISRRGWDEAQFNQEAASELRGKLGESWNKFMTSAMFMFGAAEKVNRATTLFAAYKAVRESEPTADESIVWEKAKEISDRAHGIYGKETIPAWARGKYNILRLTYTFQKFSHNYMLNMIDLGFNRKEYKAAAYMMLSPALLAGSSASLAGTALFSLAGALGIGGDDPEEEWYKWAEESFGGGSFARHGIFGAMAGINIKGSLQMNNPMPTTLEELAGPVGGIYKDTKRGVGHLFNGELFKGVESLLPTAFGSFSKSWREANEGITTGSYGSVFYGDEPLKATTADAMIRFLSFNPSRISGIREMQWHEKQVKADYQKTRSKINAKIKRSVLQGKGITPEILKEIKVYNDRVAGSGRIDITRITPKSIIGMLKRNQKGSKLERNRAVNE